MRISVNKDDVGYSVFASTSAIKEVLLDGELIKDCLTADEEQGMVVRLEFRKIASTEATSYGKVQIILDEDWEYKDGKLQPKVK